MAGRWIAWLVEPPVASRPDRGVDHRLLVDALRQRAVVVAVAGDRRQPVHRGAGQRLPQRRARLDEGRARHVQPHHLHHHLVGVGGAVEGAGARRVVGLGSRSRAARRGSPCPRRRAGGRAAFPCWRSRSASGRTGRTPPAASRSAARRSAGPARSCRRCRAARRCRTSGATGRRAAASAITSRLNRRQLHARPGPGSPRRTSPASRPRPGAVAPTSRAQDLHLRRIGAIGLMGRDACRCRR